MDTYDEVVRYLGAKPVLSKLCVIAKEKLGKVSKRIVLDANESKVSRASRRGERVVLPRALDAVFDALQVMKQWSGRAARGAASRVQENVEFLVLDFEKAFWNVPLWAGERRYFVVKYRGRFYVVLRVAQCSRGGPLVWCR